MDKGDKEGNKRVEREQDGKKRMEGKVVRKE